MKDAEWIATVLLKDLVRNSFVPDGMIRQLRLYGRRINELNKDVVHCEQRIDMILQSCNIRISNYVSDISGKSYTKVVYALIGGERSPDTGIHILQQILEIKATGQEAAEVHGGNSPPPAGHYLVITIRG